MVDKDATYVWIMRGPRTTACTSEARTHGCRLVCALCDHIDCRCEIVKKRGSGGTTLSTGIIYLSSCLLAGCKRAAGTRIQTQGNSRLSSADPRLAGLLAPDQLKIHTRLLHYLLLARYQARRMDNASRAITQSTLSSTARL